MQGTLLETRLARRLPFAGAPLSSCSATNMACSLQFDNYEGVFNCCVRASRCRTRNSGRSDSKQVCKEPKHWMTVDPSHDGDNEQNALACSDLSLRHESSRGSGRKLRINNSGNRVQVTWNLKPYSVNLTCLSLEQ